MIKRTNWLLALVLLTGAGAWAQTSQITIGTSIPGINGPMFIVDGTTYNTAQTFIWPTGTEHFVSFPLSQDAQGNTEAFQSSPNFPAHYIFGGWQDNTGLLAAPNSLFQTVIATPALTSLIANITIQYPIYIQFDQSGVFPATPSCTGVPTSASPGTSGSGVVYLDGTCYSGNATIWAPVGTHSIEGLPYPGYAFDGWLVTPGGVQPFVSQITTTQQTSITPYFVPAKRVEFRTNPVGLSLLVDTSTIQTPPTTQIDPTGATNCTANYTQLSGLAPPGFTPLCIGDFDWIPGSQHTIGALTPQQDASGAIWTFENFSTGQGQNSVYTANLILNSVDVVTANFVPAVRVTFTTYPTGLPLTVDGRSNWPGYSFFWGAGDTHTVSAPSLDTDAQGRQWAFVGWSNGGTQSQSISVPSAPNASLTLSATYAELGQINVTSSPSGLSIVANGNPCTTPCTVNGANGTQIPITIPSSTGQSLGSRYDLTGWNDGSTATTRQYTFTSGVQNLSISYHASFLLTTATNPVGGATISVAPASSDSYYPQGTPIVLSVTPKNGYKFASWGGDLAGVFSPGYLTMSTPHSVIANLTQVPFLAPTGIQTIAGPSLDGTVAAGSLIAVYGSNLATTTMLGPSNPLAQTIAGTTATIGSELLPLIFVSSGQVNAQLPSNLPPGNYTLDIQNVGQPDVTGTLTVARDAPVFYQQTNPQNQPLVLATHADGTLINFTSPARRNEQITIYITGCGPLSLNVPDGYGVPSSPPYNVADPVMLNFGNGLQVTPDSATGAPGLVGTTIVKVTITQAFPAASTLNLVGTVNGKNTPQVVLPVQ